MTSKIAIIARTSFHEFLRERVTLVIGGLALVLAFVSVLLGELTIDEVQRLVVDLSFFATEAGAVALALMLGATTMTREIERQTCLLVLARPVSRSQFLLGKWLGSAGVLAMLVAVLTLTLAVIGGLGSQGAALIAPEASILMKALVVLAWTMLASIGTRPFVAGLAGFAIYLVGHWLGDLEFFAKQSNSELALEGARALRWVVPSFDLYNWKSHFYLGHPPSARDILGMISQTVAFIAIGLGLAGVAFGRKDIV